MKAKLFENKMIFLLVSSNAIGKNTVFFWLDRDAYNINFYNVVYHTKLNY